MDTLPATNSSPLRIVRAPQGMDHLPTINFQGFQLAVSFKKGTCFQQHTHPGTSRPPLQSDHRQWVVEWTIQQGDRAGLVCPFQLLVSLTHHSACQAHHSVNSIGFLFHHGWLSHDQYLARISLGKSKKAASPVAATWFFMTHVHNEFPPPSRGTHLFSVTRPSVTSLLGKPQWKARWVGGLPVLACGINDTFLEGTNLTLKKPREGSDKII